MANDETQDFSISSERNAHSVKEILSLAIKVIEECFRYSDGTNMYAFLYYDTYNNLARVENATGNIEKSLEYLHLALEYTRYFTASGNKQSSEEIIQSTVLPELQFNICTAEMYLNRPKEALKSAKLVAEQTEVRMNLLDQRIKDPYLEVEEKPKLQELLKQHCELHIKAYLTRGEIFQKQKNYNKAVEEYTQAKFVISHHFSSHCEIAKQTERKLKSVMDDKTKDALAEYDREKLEIESQKKKLKLFSVDTVSVVTEPRRITKKANDLEFEDEFERKSVLQPYENDEE